MGLTRRLFLRAGAGAAVAAFGYPRMVIGRPARGRVVIIGGGIGGSTAAKYLRMMDPEIEVTLIEPQERHVTCFGSNEVLSGERRLDGLNFGYAGLRARGINVVRDLVLGIDPVSRRVTTSGGRNFAFDRAVVSPGVALKYGEIEGYSVQVAEKFPHAWKAGPQTALLRRQLVAMRDGGTVIVSAPRNPYRCPPAPYERVSQIAWYLKNHKPRSKIIILDAKDTFSKQALFLAGWRKHYGFDTPDSLIDLVPRAEGGTVMSVNPATMTLEAAVDDYKGDVINIIPAQKAGAIAVAADLADRDWCPVDQKTFESTRHRGIYVIGDAAIAGSMPKSGFAANSQAKVCAAAIVAELNGLSAPEPSYLSACYSLLMPEDAISVVAVYRLGADGKIAEPEGAGGVTPGYGETTMEMRRREADHARSWFDNITADVFG